MYLDLEGRNDLSRARFYQEMCTEIRNGLREALDASVDPALKPEDVKDQTAFLHYLTLLAAHTPQARKLILMFDEIGGVPEQTSATFFPSLRRFYNLGQSPSRERDLYRKVMFIFAGSLDLQRLLRGKNSPLRNVCELFSLDDFTRAQGRDLASNLEGLSDGAVTALAEAVYGWCDGHPYLTQRLYALIEATPECRTATAEQLPGIVDHLVTTYFLHGNDANLAHILNYLQENEAYRTPIFQVLKSEKRKGVMLADDLSAIGIIKRSSNLDLIIRNKVYEQRLNNFFAEEEENPRQ